ncbi:MAG: fatty acid desaturase family protein, partial [Blastocatellia bacterium]
LYLFLSISVAIVTHNHNHLSLWRSRALNQLTDYWLTIFYGFPVFAWIPTHNMNHHSLNNREGDYTITYRLTEKNHLAMLVSYPAVSSLFQQKPIRDYLKKQRQINRSRFYFSISQYLVLGAYLAAVLLWDWKKALLFVLIPQQVSLFSVLLFNYVQHVHADEESEINHSRNFVGGLNKLLFNNGYHTVHHDKAGLHWSMLPEAHAKVAHLIDPRYNERSFWWYIVRVYFLAPFVPRFRTVAPRQQRMTGGAARPAA